MDGVECLRMETLKPQDVVVVLKLCAIALPNPSADSQPRPSMAILGAELGMSSSEVHAAIRRAHRSGLLLEEVFSPRSRPPREKKLARAKGPQLGKVIRFKPVRQDRPNVSAILEFLVHGLKYVFPPHRGQMTRGIATSYAAPPLDTLIARGQEPIPVWPYPAGQQRGVMLEPLYPTVPFAALRDPSLYQLLAIADALREGRARERRIAEEQLRLRLEGTNAE